MEEGLQCPCCLLLILGIPASGKTLLVRSVLKERPGGLAGSKWIWLGVHFDDFFPPDTRSLREKSPQNFDLKGHRRSVLSNLELLLSYNRKTSKDSTVPPLDDTCQQKQGTEEKSKFGVFLQYLNAQRPVFDSTGRLKAESGSSVVFVLDDNMPLRSMRYEYFQLARKYRLGFAEVHVTCSPSLALAMNSLRATPIPEATIIAMERSLESPDPAQHHWERFSSTLHNTGQQDFLTRGIDCVLPLVQRALDNPVQPPPLVDTAQQEASRAATLASRTHQADQILRKCVSTTMKESQEDKAEDRGLLAKKANEIRKSILTEVRDGLMKSADGSKLEEICTLDSNEFEDLILKTFHSSIT